MQKYAWLTDIHLEFLNKKAVSCFVEMLVSNDLSGVFITGDISDSYNIQSHLSLFGKIIKAPIYFVLGNHDYYGSDFETVENSIKELTARFKNLHWLPNSGIIKLSENTCLIGHGGWADGRSGNYADSNVILNDYLKIKNFVGLGKAKRLELLHELADSAAAYIRDTLHQTLDLCSNVILLTHVPPFKKACYYHDEVADDHHLPHFASKVMGDTIKTVMHKHTDHRVTVYCGHTHNEQSVEIMANLHVNTGHAKYGEPAVQKIIQVPS